MSIHLALPSESHLEQVLRIFGYLNIHKNMRFIFDCSYPRIISKIFKEYYWFGFYRFAKEDIPPTIPETRGHEVSISMFVDAGIAGDKSTRRSQMRFDIFMNKAPIQGYIKRQENFEASNFGAEFCATKTGVEMVEYLRYKL